MDPTFFTVTLFGGYSTRGRPWQMSWHYRCTSDGPRASQLPEALANAITGLMEAGATDIGDVLSTGVYCTWLEVKSTYPPDYYPWGSSIPVTGEAGGTEDLLPEGSGPLILLEAGFPTPSFPRPGRIYWPGLAESLQKNGSLSSDYVAQLSEWWEYFETFIYTVGEVSYVFEHVLLSPTDPTKGYQPVVRAKVSDKVARVFRRGRTHQARWEP